LVAFLIGMMRKLFYILIISVTLFHMSYGQDQKIIDSLNTVLKNKNITDKEKTKALSLLGWNVSYADLEEGLKYASEAYKIAKQNNYVQEMAHSANVVGTIYMDMGNYPEAIDYLQRAITYSEEIHNKKSAAIASSNLSIIYNRRKEYKKALEAGFKAYANIKESPSNFISTCLNIGGTFTEMNMNDSALHFFNEALDFSSKHKTSPLLVSAVYNSLAEAYLNKKEYATAKEHIYKAINLVSDTTQYYYLTEHYVVLTKIQLETKEYPAALVSAYKSLAWSKSIGIKEYERLCYELLSKIYEGQKNIPKAFEFYKLHIQIKDTLLNTENEQQVKFMEAKFDADKKEKEIELLNKDNKLQDEKLHKNKILINAFVFGGIILLLALGLAIYAFANKRKANRKLVSLNNEVHNQRNQLLEKNKAITDSIHYAKRIQNALLTSEVYIKESIPDFFILNMPKDIVSGDFYWAYTQGSKIYFMCADCTGHGVPGAFMSLLGINFLNEIVIEKKIMQPDLVLNELRKEIIHSLNQQGSEETKDGMDAAFCCIDTTALDIQLAAANNPVWIIQPPATPLQVDETGVLKLSAGFKFTEISSDKMPVGKSPKDDTAFTLKNYKLKKGDCVFMFSDGFADQFGGPKGKKLKYKLLKETIFRNCHLSMHEQKQALQECFAEWKSSYEQVDDVLVIGIKV
jgi:serine phosphatase RsbU (regulator of sigma subunit)